jgi:hypothetical protein
MFAEPTINDFLASIDWHIRKASDRASLAVANVRGQFAAHGALSSSRLVLFTWEAARKEFDSGVEAVLGELSRAIRTTKLDRSELRQHAVQRLMNFAIAAKAVARTPETSRSEMGKYLNEQFAALDQHLQFSVRQFDVGFLNPAEPEVPAVSNNSIIIGNMADSTILQGSPEATQNVQFAFNIETSRKALAEFESALAATTIPAKTLDELMADVRTIQNQLAKPAPSRIIIHEAGKSLRNVVEGVIGGMLTPAAVNAAASLWAVLGIG